MLHKIGDGLLCYKQWCFFFPCLNKGLFWCSNRIHVRIHNYALYCTYGREIIIAVFFSLYTHSQEGRHMSVNAKNGNIKTRSSKNSILSSFQVTTSLVSIIMLIHLFCVVTYTLVLYSSLLYMCMHSVRGCFIISVNIKPIDPFKWKCIWRQKLIV